MHEAIGAAVPPHAAGRPRAADADAPYVARALALLRSRVPHILLIGLVSGAVDFLRALPLLSAANEPAVLLLLQVVVLAACMSALLVAGATFAQAAPLRGWRGTACTVAGAWCGVALGVAVNTTITVWLGWNTAVAERLVASLASWLMYLGWEYAAIGTAVALFYVAREREVALARSARDGELAHSELARSVMESRLSVLRARVEPEFLFGALDEVRALYASDRAAADAMIDALIAYLRAALPQMRGEGSTIAKEVDLVRAYAAVLQVPRGDLLAVEANVDERLRDVPLPPMVLLPIAQAALASGDVAARRRFAITATASAAHVVLDIEVDGGVRPDTWREGGPEAARRTLQAYFGDLSRLDFATEGLRHRATLTLPAAAFALPPRGATNERAGDSAFP